MARTKKKSAGLWEEHGKWLKWAIPLVVGVVVLEVMARVLFAPTPSGVKVSSLPTSMKWFVPTADGKNWKSNPKFLTHINNRMFTQERAPGHKRVVLLGGSPSRYLWDEMERFMAGLSRDLKTKVECINMGGQDFGSHRLVAALPEVLKLKPDAVILYMGNNEYEEINHFDTSQVQRGPAGPALLRPFKSGKMRAGRANLHAPPRAKEGYNYSFTMDKVRDRVEALERNATYIAKTLMGRGIPVVMMAPASNHFAPMLPVMYQKPHQDQVKNLYREGSWDTAKVQGTAFLRGVVGRHQASQDEADAIANAARNSGAKFVNFPMILSKLEPHGIVGETTFMDHAHLNEKGKRAFGLAVKPYLLSFLAKR